jgi:hypothetical protein
MMNEEERGEGITDMGFKGVLAWWVVPADVSTILYPPALTVRTTGSAFLAFAVPARASARGARSAVVAHGHERIVPRLGRDQCGVDRHALEHEGLFRINEDRCQGLKQAPIFGLRGRRRTSGPSGASRSPRELRCHQSAMVAPQCPSLVHPSLRPEKVSFARPSSVGRPNAILSLALAGFHAP